MNAFRVGGREIRYTVKATRSKYVHLRFRPNLELEVLLPKRVRSHVGAILNEKQNWIRRKYEELLARKPIFDGKRVLYRGRYHTLRALEMQNGGEQVAIHDGEVQIVAPSARDHLRVLRTWMQEETRRWVTNRTRLLARKLGLSPSGIEVRDIQRWGYCTRQGQLVFNWQLATLPLKLAEYVVLHEMAHLRQFNHSRKFRATLLALCPDYRERQKAIRGFELIPSQRSVGGARPAVKLWRLAAPIRPDSQVGRFRFSKTTARLLQELGHSPGTARDLSEATGYSEATVHLQLMYLARIGTVEPIAS